jgi:hypothetical protein
LKNPGVRLHESPFSWRRLVPYDQTDMTKVTVAFLKLAETPNKRLHWTQQYYPSQPVFSKFLARISTRTAITWRSTLTSFIHICELHSIPSKSFQIHQSQYYATPCWQCSYINHNKLFTVSIKQTSFIIHINLTDFGKASGATERACASESDVQVQIAKQSGWCPLDLCCTANPKPNGVRG